MLKKLLGVFLLLLFLPGVLFADICLTEEEYQTVMKELDNSETALILQEKQITLQEKLQQKSDKVIQMQEKELELHEKSLKKQKTDQTWKKVKAFIAGVLTFFIVDEISDRL